jgi:hypothetical protein
MKTSTFDGKRSVSLKKKDNLHRFPQLLTIMIKNSESTQKLYVVPGPNMMLMMIIIWMVVGISPRGW